MLTFSAELFILPNLDRGADIFNGIGLRTADAALHGRLGRKPLDLGTRPLGLQAAHMVLMFFALARHFLGAHGSLLSMLLLLPTLYCNSTACQRFHPHALSISLRPSTGWFTPLIMAYPNFLDPFSGGRSFRLLFSSCPLSRDSDLT